MILSHIKTNFNLKTEDGQYFSDLFPSSKEGMRQEILFKKMENKKDIVFKLTESIYFELDPSYEDKSDKTMDKTQPKTSSSQFLQLMMKNFVETFKTKEQIYWVLEILGNVFLFVGEESPPKSPNPNSNQFQSQQSLTNEKIYEKGLEIYIVILLLIQKLGCGEKQSYLKLDHSVVAGKFTLEEEDKQRLFRLVISHLSLSFEKIENLSNF